MCLRVLHHEAVKYFDQHYRTCLRLLCHAWMTNSSDRLQSRDIILDPISSFRPDLVMFSLRQNPPEHNPPRCHFIKHTPARLSTRPPFRALAFQPVLSPVSSRASPPSHRSVASPSIRLSVSSSADQSARQRVYLFVRTSPACLSVHPVPIFLLDRTATFLLVSPPVRPAHMQ